MAGLIRLNKEHAWSTAGWIFDHVLRLTRKHLPEEGSSKILELMGEAEAGLNYISLEKLSPAEVTIFLAALKEAYGEAQMKGSQSFAAPEFYPAFIKSFEELLEMAGQVE
ncbi:MAG TPA: hypothetical protein VF544_21285 [Pyrinomonadaceae bacterium]|jgi:hypothetical protein